MGYFLKVSWGSVLPHLFCYNVCAAQKCAALVSLDFEKSIIASLDTVFSPSNAPGVYLKTSSFDPTFIRGPTLNRENTWVILVLSIKYSSELVLE